MSLRPSVRFEVFKRDAFTCQYCGRKTPDVVLEVDHIIPLVEGGDDDFENLLTACWDCNRGKGGRPLDVRAPMLDLVARTEMVREREAQLREYHVVKEQEAARRNAQYDEVWNFWFESWGVSELARWHTPWENSLRSSIEKIGVAEVKDAMTITASKFTYLTADAVRYFGGICKRKIAEVEGRVVLCTVCGHRIILTQAQANENVEGWHHNHCAETADG